MIVVDLIFRLSLGSVCNLLTFWSVVGIKEGFSDPTCSQVLTFVFLSSFSFFLSALCLLLPPFFSSGFIFNLMISVASPIFISRVLVVVCTCHLLYPDAHMPCSAWRIGFDLSLTFPICLKMFRMTLHPWVLA